MVGRRLSHYEVIGEISRGGMGVVYRARDVRLGREVALKVLPPDLGHDPERRSRLVQEARAAAHLEHPHIAVIHEVDDVDGLTFIAMELVRGEKLADVLARGPLPLNRALDLALEVAEGLARAHEKAIVHRDIKPANVMVSDEGHAKIIDFGLAKLTEPASEEAATASVGRAPTEPGVVLGTAAYMSPEQARGARVDHRTDVFSLGVTLFEMVTGRPPFRGGSGVETMHAILTQPIPRLGLTLPDATVSAVQRVVDKSTAKDPDERYQGMKDLVVDLRAARRLLESTGSVAATSGAAASAAHAPRHARRITPLTGAALLAAVVAAGGLWWWNQDRGEPPRSGKRAVAVFYFENNTGDPSLDWMRAGLTDMVVTDLSQSTEFEVLGTDRLVQILQELKRADDRVIPADVVQEVASRAGVDTVLVGAFVKAGDTIRINARLQDAQTGRVVSAERVEGAGEASVFSLVDELARRLRQKLTSLSVVAPALLKPPGSPEEAPGRDRTLTEITTSSVEAYRHYSEGLSLRDRGLNAQAIGPLERAVQIDPTFAMAFVKLAVAHHNLGHLAQRNDYAARAIGLVDRLTARERYYIEGFYYSLRPETVARAIESYQKLLALHPEHIASRVNLGVMYFLLDRFTEATEQYEEVVRRGVRLPAVYNNLVNSTFVGGNLVRALEIANEFARQNPDNAQAQHVQGVGLMVNQRLDEAQSAFDRSIAMNPRSHLPKVGRLAVAIHQQRWADAETIATELRRSTDSTERGYGARFLAELSLLRGRRQAVSLFGDAAELAGTPAAVQTGLLVRLSDVLGRLGRPREAVAAANRAFASGRDAGFVHGPLKALAIAQSRSGLAGEAVESADRLAVAEGALPSGRGTRSAHLARAEIARARKDLATALAEIAKAESSLSPYGEALTAGPHMEIWLAAASLRLAAGLHAEAARTLERMQSGHERLSDLDAYARSFYLLGQAYTRLGETDKARAQYQRFLDFRGDGELDAEWVADARRAAGRTAR